MTRFVLEYGCLLTFALMTARRQLAASGIASGVRLRHYLCIAYLLVMNFSGIKSVVWALRRLIDQESLDAVTQYYVALREIPPSLAVVLWSSSVVLTSIGTILTLGLAFSTSSCRRVLLSIYPLIICGEAIAFYIGFLGDTGLRGVSDTTVANAIALGFWCFVAWPYWLAYRFYKSESADCLFMAKKRG